MISQEGWPRKTSVETTYERRSMQTGKRKVTEPTVGATYIEMQPLQSLTSDYLGSIAVRGLHTSRVAQYGAEGNERRIWGPEAYFDESERPKWAHLCRGVRICA